MSFGFFLGLFGLVLRTHVAGMLDGTLATLGLDEVLRRLAIVAVGALVTFAFVARVTAVFRGAFRGAFRDALRRRGFTRDGFTGFTLRLAADRNLAAHLESPGVC